MIHRAVLMITVAGMLACLAGSRAKATETPGVETAAQAQATIYYSFAPWDGAAYAIEIPQGNPEDAAHPCIRVSLWGYPEFTDAKTIRFSGNEDAGGGPSRGDGIAQFQAIQNKSMPQRMEGTLSFDNLLHDRPVTGTYEFSTLDGKRKFKGSFQAAWGNKPARVIR